MDAFEAIRRSAAALHARAVAEGADPSSPEGLVTVAAALLGCELATVPKADPLLRGGRALYDPEMRMIVREESPPGEGALLAAHELGHVVNHFSADVVVTVETDPSQAVEASGTAIERVGDYGRRARRELQMDLFAREFLLPRVRARALYLEQAHSAATIAERFGLPYALVAQQVLDAALLPEMEVVTAEPKPPVDLDESQTRAAEHAGSPFELQAGPGTGKTRTLIARIEKLVDAGVDPMTILVLTFSNKAAGELTERLAQSRPAAAGAVWIGTFHAFGLDVLRRFHDRLGLPDDPRLVDRADAIGLLEELVPALPLRHYRNFNDPGRDLAEVLAAISRAKDEVCDATGYEALVEAMASGSLDDSRQLLIEKLREAALIYRTYERVLDEQGAVDFGDLVMKPTLFLERDEEACLLLRDRHQHVLVDEYQDVNQASVRLLQALAGAGERLWTVGDSRQSIYRFRGASSSSMSDFETDFPGGAVDRLEVNYRSSKEVVDGFVDFAETMHASRGVLPLELESKRGSSGLVAELRAVEHPDDEAAAVAASILELKESGVSFRDQAVLCRGNARLAAVAAALEERDIPILYLGSLFARQEVSDLLALLSLLVDPRAAGLVRVATQPRYALALEEVALLLRHAKDQDEPLAWMRGAAGLLERPEAGEAFANLRTDLAGFGPTSQPWQVLATFALDRTWLVRRLGLAERPAERVQAVAIWQLLGFCRTQPGGPGYPVSRLLDRVRRLVLLAEERDLRQMPAAAASMDAVKLMTVHGSKGLEFEAVHVPGMTVSSFPTNNQPPRVPPPDGLIKGSQGLSGLQAVARGHLEEEECLFFVAMSRAKRHLRLYQTTKQVNGNRRGSSPFLDKIRHRLREVVPAPLHQPRRRSDTGGLIPVELDGFPVLSEEQIGSYERCPRRFFYTHLLGVPGSRRAGPFVRLHDVVYSVIEWLRQDVARMSLAPPEVVARFDELWAERGPVGHGYEAAYRELGLDLIGRLLDSRQGSTFVKPEPLVVRLQDVELSVTPDEVRLIGDERVLRRVRTGKLRESGWDEDDIAYTLYALAAEQNYGGTAKVEVVHLTGGVVTPITFTPKKLETRRGRAMGFARDIAQGRFATKPNDRTCPYCPHFFICDAVPQGPLRPA